MYTRDVVLITEDRYAAPAVIDDYIANILEDDALLMRALSDAGLSSMRVSWSDPHFDWSSARCAVFRTTWDYFTRFEEFCEWLNATEKKTQMINDPATVRWNMDKHYLLDLQSRGIPIVETHIIEQGSKRSLVDALAEFHITEGIIKPAVSGAARHTYRVNRNNVETLQATWSSLLQHEAMLLQPFQEHIIQTGEVSCMLMGGQFTHAVIKKAKPGDFRVQDDHGGTVYPYTPTVEEIQFAEQAVAACDTLPAYARVDFTRNADNSPVIMELELIEPELWFRKYPPAAHILAEYLKKKLA